MISRATSALFIRNARFFEFVFILRKGKEIKKAMVHRRG